MRAIAFVYWLLVAQVSALPTTTTTTTTEAPPSTTAASSMEMEEEIVKSFTTKAALSTNLKITPPTTLKGYTTGTTTSETTPPSTGTALPATTARSPLTTESAIALLSATETKKDSDDFTATTVATLAGTSSTLLVEGNEDRVATSAEIESTATLSTSTQASTVAIVTREEFLTMNNVTKEDLKEGLPLPVSIAKSLQTADDEDNDGETTHKVNTQERDESDTTELIGRQDEQDVELLPLKNNGKSASRGKSEDFSDSPIPLVEPDTTTTASASTTAATTTGSSTSTTTTSTTTTSTRTTTATTTTRTTTITTTSTTTATTTVSTTTTTTVQAVERPEQSLPGNDTFQPSAANSTETYQIEETSLTPQIENVTEVEAPPMCEEQWSNEQKKEYYKALDPCDQVNPEKTAEVITLPEGYVSWNNIIWVKFNHNQNNSSSSSSSSSTNRTEERGGGRGGCRGGEGRRARG